jgi:hypothetical protein
LFSFAVDFGFLYWVLREAGAGTVSVMFATMPLITQLIAALIGQDELTWREVLGSSIVIAGVIGATLSAKQPHGDECSRHGVAALFLFLMWALTFPGFHLAGGLAAGALACNGHLVHRGAHASGEGRGSLFLQARCQCHLACMLAYHPLQKHACSTQSALAVEGPGT